MNHKIHCKVTRSSPLATFRWQYQNGPCLNFDRDCKPSNAKWQDITFDVSPAAGVATAKSTVTIPQDVGSGFFRCIATNVLGSDDHYLRFFAIGELRSVSYIPTIIICYTMNLMSIQNPKMFLSQNVSRVLLGSETTGYHQRTTGQCMSFASKFFLRTLTNR